MADTTKDRCARPPAARRDASPAPVAVADDADVRRFRDGDPDAVQQTFLQAWRAAPSYDPDRPLAPWLFQIGRRVCIDRERREKAVAGWDPALTVVGPSIERNWMVWEVRRAIEELPADAREVIRLLHLEGYAVEQAAAHLSLPLGTVTSRSFRAHRKLVALLDHLRAPEEELVA